VTESTTAPIRRYLSMSLDGFIAGPDDRPGQELGQGGGRLVNWADDRMAPGPNGQVFGGAQHDATTGCGSQGDVDPAGPGQQPGGYFDGRCHI
jgi:hypothetical protein